MSSRCIIEKYVDPNNTTGYSFKKPPLSLSLYSRLALENSLPSGTYQVPAGTSRYTVINRLASATYYCWWKARVEASGVR
eukprot:scaffold13544_cov50-Attheya_sp.AAC.3